MRSAFFLACSLSTLVVTGSAVAAPRVKPSPLQPANRPASLKADGDFDLSGFESVTFVKPVAGGKYLTAYRVKPQTLSNGQKYSGGLGFRVESRASAALSQSFGSVAIGPVIDDPAQLRTIDATVDDAGALFVGYISDTLSERQYLRVAKYLPLEGHAPVVTPVFKVTSRDQALGRSIVADGDGGVFVRGYTWDAASSIQVAIPFTRRYSPTGDLSWEQRGTAAHSTAAAPSENCPVMLMGVADGNGGLFEALNVRGVKGNNLAPDQDRARILQRRADGSVAYDREIAITAARAARGRASMKVTPGSIMQIFLASDQQPVLVYRTNGNDTKRQLLDVDAAGASRVVATLSDEDFIMQGPGGNIVVVSQPSSTSLHYTLTQFGIAGDKLQRVAKNTTPDLAHEKQVWSQEPSQVSIGPNGVVVVASHDKIEGRPTVLAMTLEGKIIGSAKSPKGADMIVNDGKRYFGFVLSESGWAYKAGVIDLGTAAPAVHLVVPH